MSAERAYHRCSQLAAISEMEGGILRQYLTAEHQKANELTASWMREAGMSTWVDAVGNQWGRLKSKQPHAKSLLIGSHLDTVPNAGAYDGILGVLLGIELADYAYQSGLDLPFHLDVVGFCDEEGTRFGTTLIGSKALAGQFSSEWLALTDKDGESLESALRNFGLDASKVQSAALNPDQLVGYLEPHIEQGPVLDNQHLSLGIVTAIAGARRAKVTFEGRAGHAGTTPMNARTDAFTAGCEWALFVEAVGHDYKDQVVATVGAVEVSPNAVNVIPGLCELSLDIRSQDDRIRDRLCTKIAHQAKAIATKRGLRCHIEWTHNAPAVPCDNNMMKAQREALIHEGIEPFELPSGAGHDAMAIDEICPIAMFFIRSPEGISHHPEESVRLKDLDVALLTMIAWLNIQKSDYLAS